MKKLIWQFVALIVFSVVGISIVLINADKIDAAQVGVRITQSIPQHGHNDMYDGGVLKNTGGYNDDTIYYHTLFEGSTGYGLVGDGTLATDATWVTLSTGSVIGQYKSMVKDPEWTATPTWTKSRKIKAVVKFNSIDTNTTVFIWSGVLSNATVSVDGGGGGGGFGKPSVPSCTLRTNGIGFKMTNGVLYGCSAAHFTQAPDCDYTLISSVSATTKYIIEARYDINLRTSFYVNGIIKGYGLYTPTDTYCATNDGYPQNIFNIFIRTDEAANKAFSISEYKFLQER